MVSFPILTVDPDPGGWEEEAAFDPTIRSRSEGGYLKTRPYTTRVPRKWKFQYLNMTLADKQVLQAFETSVLVGSDAFLWTDSVEGVVYTVRFSSPIKCSPMTSKLFWQAQIELEQV